MKKLAFLLGCCLIGLWFWRDRGAVFVSPVPSVDQAPRVEKSSLGDREALERAVDRRAIGVGGVRQEDVSATDSVERNAFGAIAGSVFGADLEPLQEEPLSFTNADSFLDARRMTARTDEHGRYFIEQVPVGDWTVSMPGGVGQGRFGRTLTVLGQVEVSEGQTALLDAVLAGSRIFEGRVAFPELEELATKSGGPVMDLELVDEATQLVVARSQVGFIEAETGQETDSPEERRDPSGLFRFRSLADTHYRAVVWLNDSKQAYAERQIDLTDGDVSLVWDLTFDDFLPNGDPK